MQGQQPLAKVVQFADVSTSAWEAQRAYQAKQGQKFENAQRALLVNAALIAGLIASAIYAPVAQYSGAAWLLCSIFAGLLTRRGVNWQTAWREASLKLAGY